MIKGATASEGTMPIIYNTISQLYFILKPVIFFLLVVSNITFEDQQASSKTCARLSWTPLITQTEGLIHI